METVHHRTTAELDEGLDHVRASPADAGVLELIAARPAGGERRVVEVAELSAEEGLVGDNWLERGSRRGPADPDKQVTIMNSRLSALIAGSRQRWALAGDQLYVDLDLSEDNLPAGTRLSIGETVVEVSAAPHTGCTKFSQRFGREAARFVNTGDGKRLRLRGINARVVQGGRIRVGDPVHKLS